MVRQPFLPASAEAPDPLCRGAMSAMTTPADSFSSSPGDVGFIVGGASVIAWAPTNQPIPFCGA